MDGYNHFDYKDGTEICSKAGNCFETVSWCPSVDGQNCTRLNYLNWCGPNKINKDIAMQCESRGFSWIININNIDDCVYCISWTVWSDV